MSDHPSWIGVVRMYRAECGMSYKEAVDRANAEFRKRGWEIPKVFQGITGDKADER